jgi:hypothetical protein
MTVEEAVRQIRRGAGRLRETQKILEQVQRAIAAPSAQEVREMADGTHPLSAEAHLLGVIQDALRALENVETDLRFAAAKRTRQRLEREWKRGKLPHGLEIRSIEAALAALRECVLADSIEPAIRDRAAAASDRPNGKAPR